MRSTPSWRSASCAGTTPHGGELSWYVTLAPRSRRLRPLRGAAGTLRPDAYRDPTSPFKIALQKRADLLPVAGDLRHRHWWGSTMVASRRGDVPHARTLLATTRRYLPALDEPLRRRMETCLPSARPTRRQPRPQRDADRAHRDRQVVSLHHKRAAARRRSNEEHGQRRRRRDLSTSSIRRGRPTGCPTAR